MANKKENSTLEQILETNKEQIVSDLLKIGIDPKTIEEIWQQEKNNIINGQKGEKRDHHSR